MIVSLLYKMTWKLLSFPVVVLRGEAAKDAELLVLRRENTVLHDALLWGDRPPKAGVPPHRPSVAETR